MPRPFTNPRSIPITSIQVLLDELVLSLQERQRALGIQPVYQAEPDRDIQSVDFWRTFQFFCLSAINNFLNFKNGYSAEPFGDYSNLFEAANLPSSGFRRAQNWSDSGPEWIEDENNYGVIEEGDIIGWWLIEDLQKVFSIYRWSRKWIQLFCPFERIGETVCNASEVSYSELFLNGEKPLLIQNAPTDCIVRAGWDCEMDDYLEIGGVKLNDLSLVEWVDTTTCPGKYGKRKYKPGIILGTVQKDNSITIDIYDTLRGDIGPTLGSYFICDWQFTYLNEI